MNLSSLKFKHFCDSIIPSQDSGLPSLYEVVNDKVGSIEIERLINSFKCLFDSTYENFRTKNDEKILAMNKLRAPLRRQFLEKAFLIYCSHRAVQQFIYSAGDPIGAVERVIE